MSAKPSISLTEGVGIAAVKNERQSCQGIKSGLSRIKVRAVENEKKDIAVNARQICQE